jgi:cation diffusion facilitator family transporter
MGKQSNENEPKHRLGDRSEEFILRPREDRGTQTKEHKDSRRRESSATVTRHKALERARVNVARLSVASNTTLMVLKLAFGIFMGSISVISEGIHSGMDLLAAIIATMAVGRSLRPPDEDHKYGHGKYEPISGTIEAILIFIAAILIIYESVLKLLGHGQVTALEGGIFIMLLSVIFNLIVSRKLMKVAKETDSLALEADALHLSTDVLTSAGVLIGLVIIRVTKIWVLDPIVAIMVAMLIIKAAYDLTRKTMEDLSDQRIPKDEEDCIIKILKEHDHVVHDYHDLRTRRSGQNRYIDLHIVVSRDLGHVEAHRLCDHLEAEIKKCIDHSNVLIHSEPCDGICIHCDEDEVCRELRIEKLERLKRRKAQDEARDGEVS